MVGSLSLWLGLVLGDRGEGGERGIASGWKSVAFGRELASHEPAWPRPRRVMAREPRRGPGASSAAARPGMSLGMGREGARRAMGVVAPSRARWMVSRSEAWQRKPRVSTFAGGLSGGVCDCRGICAGTRLVDKETPLLMAAGASREHSRPESAARWFPFQV